MQGLLWGIFFFVLQVTPLAAQPATLSLNTFAGPPLSTPDQSGYYDQILREAFHRLGISITIGHLPAERSLVNANTGIDDGDFVRIAGIEKIYPYLLRVPEKIDDFEFVAFTKRVNLRTENWEALAPYHVGIVRGWKILEKNLRGVQRLIKVKNQHLLFTMLKQDRVDAVVYARQEGYGLIQQLQIQDAVGLEPPLAKREMFLYLNRKHADLVEPLAMALRQMKADGAYAAIARQTLINLP